MVTPSFQKANAQTRVADAGDTTMRDYKKPFLEVEM